MKKALKIGLIVAASIFLLLIILPFAFKGKIDSIIKKEADKALTAKLDFESLGISLIRNFPNATIDIKGLSIEGTGKFEGDTLLSARRISATVNVMSLFRDTGFEISKISLDAPHVKAIVLADGAANWDIMRTDSTSVAATSEEPSSFKLSVKDFRVDDGKIVFIDDSMKLNFYAENLKLRLQGDLTADRSDLRLSLTASGIYAAMGKIKMLSGAATEMDVSMIADFKESKYTFERNRVKINALEFGIDGWVAMPGEAIDMDLKLNSSDIKFRDVLSMIPAMYTKDFKDLTASGDLTFDAWAKGRMLGDTLPQFAVEASVKNGSFKYASLPKSVDNINIAASVTNSSGLADNTVINVPHFSLSFAGNSVDGSLRVVTPVSDPDFSAKAKGAVNLGAIKDVYPLGDSITLSGTVTADIAIAGRMSDIENQRYEKVKGEGSAKVVGMTTEITGMPKMLISSASANITPAAMNLSELKMTFGRSDLSGSGSITNYLPYILKDQTLSGNLKITSNRIDLNELMAAQGESPAGADTLPMTAFEVPRNLNLKAEAAVKEILFQKMTLSNLSGQIGVADGTLTMNRLNMNAFGGSVQASGTYSTAKNVLTPELGMSLNFAKASFSQTFRELEMVQKFVPLFERIGGTYSLAMDLKTLLDSEMQPNLKTMTGGGVIESGDLKLQDIKAFDMIAQLLNNNALKNIDSQNIKIKFEIVDGFIHTAPFDIRMGNVKMNLAGATGLDQTIDYNAKVALPGGGLAAALASNVNVHIGGTFNDPKVELGLKEAIQGAATQILNEKITQGAAAASQEITKYAEQLRAQADSTSKKLIEAARLQGDKLIEKAKDPLTKLAAKTSADMLLKEAEKQSAKIKEEAEKKIAEKLKQAEGAVPGASTSSQLPD